MNLILVKWLLNVQSNGASQNIADFPTKSILFVLLNKKSPFFKENVSIFLGIGTFKYLSKMMVPSVVTLFIRICTIPFSSLFPEAKPFLTVSTNCPISTASQSSGIIPNSVILYPSGTETFLVIYKTFFHLEYEFASQCLANLKIH